MEYKIRPNIQNSNKRMNKDPSAYKMSLSQFLRILKNHQRKIYEMYQFLMFSVK